MWVLDIVKKKIIRTYNLELIYYLSYIKSYLFYFKRQKCPNNNNTSNFIILLLKLDSEHK